MCGIIWVKQRNEKPAVKKLRKLYHAQKSRGQLGFGYVEIDPKKVGELVRTRYENEIFKTLSKSTAKEVLFHHRFPTSTPNTPNTAHPIPVSNKNLKYDYYGVHNGVLYNHAETKKTHEKEGYKYTTELEQGVWDDNTKCFYSDYKKDNVFNDSEALIVDLAIAIESGAEKILSKGSIAFILLQYDKATRKPVKLFFGRNTNPLFMEVTGTHIKLSSQGGGTEIEPHKLHCYDYATGEINTLYDFQVGENTIPYRAPAATKHHHGSRAIERKEYDDFGYEEGKVWSEALNYYVWPPGHKSNGGMGFDTSRDRTPKQLPIPREIDPDDEFNYELVKIEGHELEPLKITMSSGETVEFTYLAELDEFYVNIIESIEYWRDTVRCALDEKDNQVIEEGRAALQVLLEDEKKLKHVVNQIYPQAKITKEIVAEPLV